MILSYSGFNAYTVYKSVDQTIYQRNELNQQQENQENITTAAPKDDNKQAEHKNEVNQIDQRKAMESVNFTTFTEGCQIMKPSTKYQQTERTAFKIFVYYLPRALNKDLVKCMKPHKTESCFR